MTFFDALFYYVLGGFTFLPLCAAALVAYVWYTAEPVDPILDAREAEAKARGRALADDVGAEPLKPIWPGENRPSVHRSDTSGPSALDGSASAGAKSSATTNQQQALSTSESTPNLRIPKDGHDVEVPLSARRLGPVHGASGDPSSFASSQSQQGPQLKPFRAGWVTVRRHFDVVPPAPANAAAPAAATSNAQGNASGSMAGSSNNPSGADSGLSPNEKDDDAASIKSTGSNQTKRSMVSAVYRGILDYRTQRAEARRQRQLSASGQPSEASLLASGAGGSSGSGTAANGQAQGPHPISTAASASQQQVPVAAGRDIYYCMLKGPILYIYSSDDIKNANTECYAAIDMRGKRVSMYVSGVGDAQGEPGDDAFAGRDEGDTESDELAEKPALKNAPGVLSSTTSSTDTEDSKRAQLNWRKAQRAAIKDGELFVKRNAVRIVSFNTTKDADPAFSQWFVFAKSASQLEDWYHCLVHASWLPKKGSKGGNGDAEEGTTDPLGASFSTLDMVALLASLDSIPDPIPMRWLNAVFGRIFFTIYRTEWLENYITSKMMKKIRRVKTPTFLSNLRVREVDVGRSPPAFSRPMLKTLTGEGEASMEVAIHYKGQIRITISTDLTISLGSRFKPYTVSLLLAVIIRSLEGNLLLMIKPPPSNRLWFGFTALPKMTIGIEPVVSERKVQWGMVTRLIEGRIRELLSESLVVPNMDDVPFFDTRKLDRRGGVWASAAKTEPSVVAAAVPAPAPGSAAASKTEQPVAAPTAKVPPVKSAPITPVGTPPAPGTPTNDDGAEPVADSSAVEASSTTAPPSLRSRRAPSSRGVPLSEHGRTGSTQSDGLLGPAAPNNSSAAIAGLRNTLSRDMAATRSVSSSGSPDLGATTPTRTGQSSSSSRRRSWLPLGQKQGAPLSSMALGHASFVREGQENPSYSGTDAQSYSSDTDGGISGSEIDRAPSLRSRDSQASMSADEGGDFSGSSIQEEHAEGDESTTDHSAASQQEDNVVEELQLSAQHEVSLPSIAASSFEDEIDRTSTPVSSNRRPSQVASESSQAASDLPSNDSEPRKVEAEAPALHELDATPPIAQKEYDAPQADIAGPPTPRTSRAASSVTSSSSSEREQSSHSRASTLTTEPEVAPQTGSKFIDYTAPKSQPAEPAERAAPERSESSRSESSNASPALPARREAPPARPHIFEDGRPTYDPYARSGQEGVALNNLNLQTTALWNKAKASLADKESRQAAAKDAKEAIKKGWANWNAKRAENRAIANQTAPGMVPQQDRTPSWSSGRSEARAASGGGLKDYSVASVSATSPGGPVTDASSGSRWFASSPPDPAAMGLGIDTSRNGTPRIGSIFGTEQTSNSPAARNDGTKEATAPDHARPAYREYLASKRRDEPKNSDGSSVHSGNSERRDVPVASLIDFDSDVSTSSQNWTSSVPSLAAPKPTAKAEVDSSVRRKDTSGTGAHTLLASPVSLSDAFADPAVRPPVPTVRHGSSSSMSSQRGRPAADVELPTLPSDLTGVGRGSSKEREMPTPAAAVPRGRSDPLDAPSQNVSTTAASNATETASREANLVLSSPEKTLDSAPAPYLVNSPPLVAMSPGGPTGGVRKQPPRAPMMAVPGIPAAHKSEPQSFSAPVREEDKAEQQQQEKPLAASLNALRKWTPGSSGTQPAGVVSSNTVTDSAGANASKDEGATSASMTDEGGGSLSAQTLAQDIAAGSDGDRVG
ncbi:hypothetical protein OC846_000527 [Tilletia horrida]|uniref:SMP-LTD domain-containing protein n=1 Tax=Tilletia horrida TaxID=155126 RepID=A0AAN6GU93_9BASI|nr:hypothetical protein OC845_000610 [Tilletia horrida]KAK0557308.1 hypothetical protein OC846_000527 [Tilletia horrida]